MTKFKLIGATLLAAVLLGVSPVGAAIISQPAARNSAGDSPAFGSASINQGSGDTGIQEMASKKAKKKKKKSKAS